MFCFKPTSVFLFCFCTSWELCFAQIWVCRWEGEVDSLQLHLKCVETLPSDQPKINKRNVCACIFESRDCSSVSSSYWFVNDPLLCVCFSTIEAILQVESILSVQLVGLVNVPLCVKEHYNLDDCQIHSKNNSLSENSLWYIVFNAYSTKLSFCIRRTQLLHVPR
jgi:hypothetical protein